jgi:hypothetical protein
MMVMMRFLKLYLNMVMIGMTLKWWKMIVSNVFSFCILHICTLLCAVTVSNVTENGDIFVGRMSCCNNMVPSCFCLNYA